MGNDDYALIRSILAGDKDAYGPLVERHSQSVFRVAFRITEDEADADEVVQETFLRGYRSLENFDARSNFRTWIYRIAMNCALDVLNKRKNQTAVPIAEEYDEGQAAVQLADRAAGPDRLLLSQEIQARRHAAMGKLTPTERIAFVLRHMEDRSTEEIATALGSAELGEAGGLSRSTKITAIACATLGEVMKHLTEEEMIEHYYSEDLYKADAEIHLQACRQCSQSYEELGKLLGSVRGPEPLPRSSDYGAQVWQSIQGALQPYQAKQKRSFFQWPQLAYAAACLLFLAGAFLAGRMWEHAHTKPLLATSTPQQTKERVVLFVLDNHLDRSERLLVQLNHAGAEGEQVDLPLRGEAQQLLTDNRLYRQSVAQSNDPLLTAALDHLERVLLEVDR